MLACDLCHQLHDGPENVVEGFTIAVNVSVSKAFFPHLSETRDLCKPCKERITAKIQTLLTPASPPIRRTPSDP